MPTKNSLAKTARKTEPGARGKAGASSSRVRPKFFISLFFIGLCLSLLTACPKDEAASGDGDRPLSFAGSWTIFRGDAALRGQTKASLPEKLALAFRLDAGKDDGISSSPVIANGVLYVGTLNGNIVAFDLASRKKIWEFGTEDSIEAPPLLVPEADLVACGALDGSFYALEASTGKLRWKASTEGQIMGSANVFVSSASGGRGLVVGSYDNRLYSFALDDGRLQWSYQTGNYVNGSPALWKTFTAFGGCDARLHIVDLADGRETGVVNTGAYIAGSAAIADGIAFIGNYSGRFLAVDLERAAIVWDFVAEGGGAGFAGSPALSQNRVVAGGKDSFVYCFDRASGKLFWKYRASSEVLSSPLADAARVFVAAADGGCALLDLATGRETARFELGAGVKGSPAVAGNILALPALDGKIYVFAAKVAP